MHRTRNLVILAAGAVVALSFGIVPAAAVALPTAPATATAAMTDPPPANWPDPTPYGTADTRSQIGIRSDNSMFLNLELRPQDESLGRVWMRDSYVNMFMVNGAPLYVATGTTRAKGLTKAAPWNDGIYMWTAPALDGPWTLVDTTGIRPDQPKGKVWSPEFYNENTPSETVVAPWQMYKNPNNPATKAGEVWAPEIDYVNGKWYITSSMGSDSPTVGSFVLVSDDGPAGPYYNIPGNVAAPLGPEIDGGMFVDTDGSAYFVLRADEYAKFNADMTDIETPGRLSKFQQTPYSPEPYREGASVFKEGGKYFLIQSIWSLKKANPALPETYSGGSTKDQYDAVVAVADSIGGPYSQRYTAVIGGGHNNFFTDQYGQIWSTFFQNGNAGYWSDPRFATVANQPGVVKLEWTGPDGNRLYAQRPATLPTAPTAVTATATPSAVAVSWKPPASTGGSPVTGYRVYRDGFTDPVATTGPGATSATVAGVWPGDTATFSVSAVNAIGESSRSNSTSVTVPDGSTSAPAQGRLSNDNGWDTGLQDGSYNVTMNLWWGENGSIFRLYENGALISTKQLTFGVVHTQTIVIPVASKSNGTYVYTGELVNSKGETATTSTTVKVTQANPGAPVLSQNNRDGDGSYTVTANLWWGTNATSYKFYENDVLLEQGALTANTPATQVATLPVSGRAIGSYIYRVEFVNAAGSTSSSPVTVTVTK